MLTPYPARNNPFGFPSCKAPKINGSRLNSLSPNVMWEITTAIEAIALSPFKPGKYIGLSFILSI